MTPAQRALILHALGLTPRDGVTPRWSHMNATFGDVIEWPAMLAAGWVAPSGGELDGRPIHHVTRLGAEAAGVLGRCRREDVGRCRTKKDVAGFYLCGGLGCGLLVGSIGDWMPAWFAVTTAMMIGVLVTIMAREWQRL